ncbi:NADH dehydrogenase [Ceratobasidium sp. AG-Ba]|nr:NADH dehydrogenase [Ceratobasidium sp. AG-Ba]
MMHLPRAAALVRRQAPRFAATAARQPLINRSVLARTLATPASQVPPTPTPPPSGPNAESTTGATPIIMYKPISRWRAFLQTLGRVTLITLVTGTGVFIYTTQKIVILASKSRLTRKRRLSSSWDLDGAQQVCSSLSIPKITTIIQPTRYITRHKSRRVYVYEAEAQSVDPIKKTVTFEDNSPIKGGVSSTTIPYDYLVYAVGAETQTFGIPGVRDIESAAFKDQSDEEIDRLLHTVVEDLENWYPDIAHRLRITLIEALPNVLPTFSSQLIKYTESTFKENKIDVLTKTMVKEIKEKSVIVQNAAGERVEIPFGTIVWAAGNVGRPITRNLMGHFPEHQTNRRGITVDDFLCMKGAEDIFAVGDCTATSYAPTAQVASQEGTYLARLFGQLAKKEKLEKRLNELRSLPQTEETAAEVETVVKQINKASKIRPFHYSHQGSLAYIGSEKAIADLPFMNGNFASGGVATYLFWRSAYLSNLFSLRNRVLVLNDWLKVKIFGRDVSRE